jgi:hypothetical protein
MSAAKGEDRGLGLMLGLIGALAGIVFDIEQVLVRVDLEVFLRSHMGEVLEYEL